MLFVAKGVAILVCDADPGFVPPPRCCSRSGWWAFTPGLRGAVPLAVGVLWFPLQGAGFATSGGVGLILGGSPGTCWGTPLVVEPCTGLAALAAREKNFREGFFYAVG
jgi:hypothetical protein